MFFVCFEVNNLIISILPVHRPSRMSYPSAHSLHRSGPSPLHPLHDLSHSVGGTRKWIGLRQPEIKFG